MVADVLAADAQFGPWNPGLQSQIPRELRAGCTIFRPENTFTAIDVATEMHDLTGLEVSDLVAFTPQRLALHELLIRVSADLSVPDGSRIEDLGINFRQITRAILSRYIEPEMDAIEAAYDAARQALSAIIATELAALLDPSRATSPAVNPRGVGARLRAFLGAGETRAAARDADEDREQRVLAVWQDKARAAAAPVERAAYRALAKVVSALVVRHGRAWGGRELIAAVALNLACNDYGSDVIGGLVDSLILRAATCRGLRAAALARPARRHEHQGCVGLGQEHVASAPEKAGRQTSACAGANLR